MLVKQAALDGLEPTATVEEEVAANEGGDAEARSLSSPHAWGPNATRGSPFVRATSRPVLRSQAVWQALDDYVESPKARGSASDVQQLTAPRLRPQIEAYIVESPILQETELGEYLSHIVGGVCVFGLRLSNSSRCDLVFKRKPNAPTPRGI